MDAPIILTRRDTIGCYADDALGNPWASFEAISHRLVRRVRSRFALGTRRSAEVAVK